MPGAIAPSPLGSGTARIAQCACKQFEAYGHLPETMQPPSTGRAGVVIARTPIKRASGLPSNTSRCAWSGNCAAIHAVAIEINPIHEVEPQPRPSSATTSI
jgi:hypothetical protein